MLNTTQLEKKYGNPEVNLSSFELAWMFMWDMPADLIPYFPHLPSRIYMNKDTAAPFEVVLRGLVANGCYTEIKTFDGWFNVRNQRASTSISIHAFGLGPDLNAAWNPFRIRGRETDAEWEVIRTQIVKWSPKFLQTWRDAGWICGADWFHRIDGMHFEFTNPLYNLDPSWKK